MNIKKIISRAPTRIDLAGGTIDLWPLYLFLEQPRTINLGIDLFAECTIELQAKVATPSEVILKSEDQAAQLKLNWKDLTGEKTFEAAPAIALHYKLLRHFARERVKQGGKFDFDLTLTTQALSPAGAGLGGSSALSVAIVGALASWNLDRPVEPTQDGNRLLDIVRDVETTVIRVPAGLQDYYGAMFGGLQSLRWGVGAHEREWLREDILSELNQRLLLFYSGQSRNSGINNWVLFKGFIDNQEGVRAKFEKIAAATRHLERALLEKNWIEVGSAIQEEWTVRKTLASGITTPEIDFAFAHAKQLGGVSGKVCGAGGGGCFFVYLPGASDTIAEQKTQIQKALIRDGLRHLPFAPVTRGLEVQVVRE